MSGNETERIIKIINAVKKHECLWNVNFSEYAKRDSLEKAWYEVAQEVGKSDVFCREKWRNVRTGFLRSVQHQIRATNYDETSVPNDFHTVQRKRFYLYDQMAFLLPSAETLEQTRKKRKLSKDRKSLMEADDGTNNDGGNENSELPEYNLVGKYEVDVENEDESIMPDDETEEEIEHHIISGGVCATDADNDGADKSVSNSNYEVILTKMEHTSDSSNNSKQNTNITPHNHVTTVHNNDALDKIVNYNFSKTRKMMPIIDKELNEDEVDTNSKNVLKDIVTGTQFSIREEEQLLNFFRGCIDDILALSKREQRLFKRRMLDLIDELHDSQL